MYMKHELILLCNFMKRRDMMIGYVMYGPPRVMYWIYNELNYSIYHMPGCCQILTPNRNSFNIDFPTCNSIDYNYRTINAQSGLDASCESGGFPPGSRLRFSQQHGCLEALEKTFLKTTFKPLVPLDAQNFSV